MGAVQKYCRTDATYGRYYTKKFVLDRVVDLIAKHLRRDDSFVDFSSGNNELAVRLNQVGCSCLPACLHACMPACLPACPPACPPACLPACLLACLPACLLACLPVCLLALLTYSLRYHAGQAGLCGKRAGRLLWPRRSTSPARCSRVSPQRVSSACWTRCSPLTRYARVWPGLNFGGGRGGVSSSTTVCLRTSSSEAALTYASTLFACSLHMISTPTSRCVHRFGRRAS